MEYCLRIEVADIPVVLRCRDKVFISDLKQRYQHFLGYREKREEVSLNIRIVDKLPAKASISRQPSFIAQTITLSNQQLLGTFLPLQRQAHLELLNKNPVESLGNFLRNLYTILFLNSHGLVLHAAGIIRGRCAYIFFGASGSGKTTIARHSFGYGILSDDQVFIKQANGSFKAFAIPYWGDMQKIPAQIGPFFAIQGLFYLVKDKEVYVRKMPMYEAVAKVLTIPNLPNELIAFAELLARFKKLLNTIPCFELHFLPDNSFWRCIDGYGKLAS